MEQVTTKIPINVTFLKKKKLNTGWVIPEVVKYINETDGNTVTLHVENVSGVYDTHAYVTHTHTPQFLHGHHASTGPFYALKSHFRNNKKKKILQINKHFQGRSSGRRAFSKHQCLVLKMSAALAHFIFTKVRRCKQNPSARKKKKGINNMKPRESRRLNHFKNTTWCSDHRRLI